MSRSYFICGLLLSLATNAAAAPIITVKARTILRLTGVYPDPQEGVVLVGQLQEQDLLEGIANRTVEVTVVLHGSPVIRRVRTDPEGIFRLHLPVTQKTFDVSARFLGDDTYAAISPEGQQLDITKQNPQIALTIDEEVSIMRAHHLLKISTRVRDRPVSLPLTISLPLTVNLPGAARSDRGSPSPFKEIVTTGPDGTADVEIPTSHLGDPGLKTLVASFAGNDRYNAAQGQVQTLLVTPVQVTLFSHRQTFDVDDTPQVQGRITDSQGPIDRATLSLEVMGQPVASTISTEKGGYQFKIRAADYPPGPVDVEVSYTPGVIWRRPARSNRIQLTIRPPRPIPIHLYAIPVAITATVMLALLLVRLWPTLKHRFAWRARHPHALVEEDMAPVRSGARLTRPSLRALIRPAHDVSGQVWDPVDNHPIPRARVHVAGRPEIPPLELIASDEGHFNAPELTDGIYQITVSHAGYVSESFPAKIPHRGSLHGLRIDLVQVRVRLLEIYSQVALSLLPDRRLWGCWTPRELARHMGRKAGRRLGPLDAMTDLIERAYWSEEPAEETVLSQARGLLDRLR